MTKTCRNVLLTVCLAIIFAAFSCLFIACEQNPEPAAYTVTVKLDEQTAAVGVDVKIRKGGATLDTKTTDSNGKAQFELVPDDYTVELSKLPELYSVAQDADLKLTAEKHDLTVTLQKSFTYTVKLVKKDGSPYYAQGVSVGICTMQGNCLEAVDLGTDGKAVIAADAGDYHVKVNDLPVGAEIAVDQDGYYSGENFSATKNEMTITVTTYDIVSLNSLTPMTDAEKDALATDDNAPYFYTKSERVSYRVNKQLAVGEIAYFSLTADIAGDYTVQKEYALTLLENGTEFEPGKDGNGLYGQLTCEKGKTYYFKAVNNGEEPMTVDFVLEVPFSTSVSHEGQGAILNVTVGKANTNAIISFKPTVAGEYTVKVTGAPAIISAGSMQPDEILPDEPAAGDYEENASCKYFVYTSKIGGYVYIAVTAKADNYPIDLQVVIEKTKNVVDHKEVKEVQANLTKFADAADGKELVALPLDAEIVKDGDGYYHFGTADGPQVLVNLTGTLTEDRLGTGGQLAYLENVTMNSAKYTFITENENVGEDSVNWAFFLRGFEEYEYDQMGNPIIPEGDKIKTEKYYTKFVNSDGVYPLTDELKDFLEKFCSAPENENIMYWNLPMDAVQGKEWLFACCYYADEVEADAIVGEYNIVTFTDTAGSEPVTYQIGDAITGSYTALGNGLADGKLAANTCKLVINKNGTWQILTYDANMEEYDSEPYDSGTWTKSDDGVYSFVSGYENELSYSNGTFTLVDSFYHVTIVLGEEPTTPPQQDTDPLVGEYNLKSISDLDSEGNVTTTYNLGDIFIGPDQSIIGGNAFDGSERVVKTSTAKLTINADGTYTVMIWNKKGEGGYTTKFDSGTWEKTESGYTFTCGYGCTLTYENGVFTSIMQGFYNHQLVFEGKIEA